jgi:hypothetical protein
MQNQVQIEDGSEVRIGGIRLRDGTGSAIRVAYDEKEAELSVVACCIGEDTVDGIVLRWECDLST